MQLLSRDKNYFALNLWRFIVPSTDGYIRQTGNIVQKQGQANIASVISLGSFR